jgi:hypothetical protein
VTVAGRWALWLLEPHDYRTPAEARDHLLTLANRGREMIDLFASASGEPTPDEQVVERS